MLVHVKLFGTLRRLSQPETPGHWRGDIPAGSTITDLLKLLGAGRYEANAVSMNGESITFETEIVENAEILLVTPMGGG